ncbi:MAG: NUDIX domain-containing protein [Acidobacteria bacterium]|nr:NUDIX domain-containing protein [Acidobacteriota bacterium]MBV8892863.1 NUDIX domain-containing protein [Acidobacteriota bacterium]
MAAADCRNARARRGTVPLSRLWHLRGQQSCEKVAAVCFRMRAGNLEFLLVRTRAGRWTFPKGNPEPGLTTAQAAALEAFEEAGVHGRMEEISFTTYVRPRRQTATHSAAIELRVTAHLCEVWWLDPPQESGRDPTWFSTASAKRRLMEKRSPGYASQLARVINRAATRVRQLRNRSGVSETLRVMDVEAFRGKMRPRTTARGYPLSSTYLRF